MLVMLNLTVARLFTKIGGKWRKVVQDIGPGVTSTI